MKILYELGIDPKIILIQIIGFVFLFFVLKKLFFERVATFIKKRQDETKEVLEKTEQTQKEVEKLKQEYQERIIKFEQEGKEIIAKAIKEADIHKKEILEEARKEKFQIVNKAKEEINIEKDKAIQEIKEKITDLVILTSSKLIEAELDEEKNRKLVKKFIDEVGEE